MGTADNPWPTVQQAADVAVADDTVIIENGNYPENVVVKNSGSQGHPITFRARNNRGAVLQAIVSKSVPGSPHGPWTSYWITVQGIDFNSPASNGNDHAVYPTTGWDIEDCTIEGYSEVGMHGDMTVNMGNITVRHCLFQDCHATSFGGYGGMGINKSANDLLHDVLVQDCIVRRSNLSNVTNTGWDGGVNKFLYSRNITVDGVIAYDNNGAAIWFDTDNQNFSVINCTIFGNHSGWFYDSVNQWGENQAANGGKALWDNTEDGFAIDTEANQGPGRIVNNVLYSNQGGRAVVQACSGNGNGITGNHQILIENNIFADNKFQIFYWSQDGPELTRGLGDTLVTHNTFYSWNGLGVQGGGTKGAPGKYNVVQSHNIYSPGSSPLVWGRWDFYLKVEAKSLADLHDLLQLEDGTSTEESLGAFPGQLPPGTITISPTKAQVEANGVKPTPAVSELTTPRSSIDAQLGNLPSDQPISAAATITVFGHTSLMPDGAGNYTCEIYDLQGRWVSLTVAGANLEEFKKLVLPYATLKGTDITVRVTRKSPYLVSAQFPGKA